MSKRVSPVTQIAEAEVKSASQPLVHSPDSEAIGSESSSPPQPIASENAAGTIHGRGVTLRGRRVATRTVSGRWR